MTPASWQSVCLCSLFVLLGLLGLGFLLLCLLDEFEDNHHCCISKTITCLENPCVTALAFYEHRCDFLEELVEDCLVSDIPCNHSAVVDAVRAGRTEELPALMEQLTASCRLAREILSQPVD